MSASQQKKVRNQVREEGLDKKTAAQQEAEIKRKKFKRRTIITVVVVVLVLAAAIFINSNYLYTKAAAVQVGDTSYSAAEFDYYYRSAYSSFAETYGDYIGFLINTSSPLDEQACTFSDKENYTWADYFKEQAETTITQVTALYDEAMAKGYQVSEENLSSIDTNLSYYEQQASSRNYTLNAYLALTFGKGMSEDMYRQIMTKYLTAVNYGQTVNDSFTYTEDELKEHYPEIADTYDRIIYHSYFFSTSDDAYSDLSDEAKASAAHDDAAAVAEAATGVEFAENVRQFLSEEDQESFEGEESTLSKVRGSSLNSSFSAWLLDPERKAGDNCVVDTSSGSYALLFVERDNNDYNTVNVRHILISAEADSDGKYTEEALETAKAKAELIYSMWMNDPTEENFISLVETNSDDTSSVANGGLYETIYKGQMVSEFDAFCFGDRKPGDAAIVYGESSQYAGYHIIYFVGEGPVFADYLSELDMRNNDYGDYVADLAANYTLTEKFAMRFAQLS